MSETDDEWGRRGVGDFVMSEADRQGGVDLMSEINEAGM